MKIEWFYQKSGQKTPIKNVISSAKVIGRDFKNKEYTSKISSLYMSRLNINSHTGYVFCQMKLDGEEMSFLPSNALAINASYSTLRNACCDDTPYRQKVTKCAGMCLCSNGTTMLCSVVFFLLLLFYN